MANIISTTKQIYPLYVVTAPKQDYPCLRKTAKLWQVIAEPKQSEAQTEAERALFFQSTSVASWLQARISQTLLPSAEIYVCKDQQNRVQGLCLAYLYKNELEIDLLITHPLNLDSPLNEKKYQVRGAGTALLNYAEKRASEIEKREIYLTSSRSSTPFFKNRGFQAADHGEMRKRISWQP